MHWIHHPGAAPDEQVWFRRTFTGHGRPRQAAIEVASSGHIIVYVNGYNVSTDMPVDGCNDRTESCGDTTEGTETGMPDSTVRVTRYDVTRFMRPDTNVVAVWYSPAAGISTGPQTDHKQLSLTFFGKYGTAVGIPGSRKDEGNGRGIGFCHTTDATWLCRTNGCRTGRSDGNETTDGSQWRADWNATDFSVTGWTGAAVTKDYSRSVLTEVPPLHTAWHTTAILAYRYAGENNGGLTYECDGTFRGMVRVTLRGMLRGDVISIGGLQYVCSGETDEQACRRFTTTTCGQVTIGWRPAVNVRNLANGRPSAARRLTPDNIMNVEGIRIEPYFHSSWLY